MDREVWIGVAVIAVVAVGVWLILGTGHPSCEPHQSLSWLRC